MLLRAFPNRPGNALLACYPAVLYIILALLLYQAAEAQRNAAHGSGNAEVARVPLINHDLNPNQPSSVAMVESMAAASQASLSSARTPVVTIHEVGPTPTAATTVLMVTHVFSSFPAPNITIVRAPSADDINEAMAYASSLSYKLSAAFYLATSLFAVLLASATTLT
ncbi:hypothetical protein SYNPS1DRAFT_28407 [Syncephalis pseudoplumigaleata]|uniref:Uncharacterized protein n=1 Tax=Syncephalis pseudoplumigaleata TaxID=1712513 RepID=A0A4V1J1Q4_9FUNG|nr:hypothetical protein SYNPS1DRAFT_28407 [Syncephalis pseudoplumigaleata]|eukprot:RKP25869.1 hypothetical protein SYNPS1DRAFT_28407 [Syncephalis pseudoplumigaleata]